MEDLKIIELFFERKECAIAETERKYGRYLFKIAYNILFDSEDCKECVNDTWLRAWNSIPPHRPQRLSLFLAKITRNLSFNRFQAKSAEKRGGGEMDLVLNKPVYLFVDESRAFALRSDDKVLVRKSKYVTKLVRLSEKSFCEIFAQKIVKAPDMHQRYRVFSSLFILKIFFLRC